MQVSNEEKKRPLRDGPYLLIFGSLTEKEFQNRSWFSFNSSWERYTEGFLEMENCLEYRVALVIIQQVELVETSRGIRC